MLYVVEKKEVQKSTGGSLSACRPITGERLHDLVAQILIEIPSSQAKRIGFSLTLSLMLPSY